MDKLTKVTKVGGVRVTQSKKPEKKENAKPLQQEGIVATSEAALTNPAQEIADKMLAEKKGGVVAENSEMIGGNATRDSMKKFPATYAPPPKPSKHLGAKLVNAKARVIQQPRNRGTN
mmetsp:Transcript_19997/g.48983  ORF Transcript_19997/g.48983 Transcript_19997/m.48983 type:complete len:118 (+) Transcript_19997:124-477(+)